MGKGGFWLEERRILNSLFNVGGEGLEFTSVPLHHFVRQAHSFEPVPLYEYDSAFCYTTVRLNFLETIATNVISVS